MSDDFLPDAPSDAEWQPVRAALRSVTVPGDAREAAVAAALAAFDELHDQVPAVAAAAPVVPLVDRRPRVQRWLTAAAAVVAVLAVGGVVVNRLAPRSDDGIVAVPAANSAVAEAVATTVPAMSEKASDRAAAGDVLTATVDSSAPALAAAPEIAVGGGEVTPSTIGSIDGAASIEATTVVDSPEALAAYAAGATTSLDGEVSPGSATACATSDSDVLGAVIYAGQPAVVVRNRATGEVAALDRVSCTVLASVIP